MKRILSLILVVSMFLSLTSFAAITNIKVYEDNTTGYTYIFGKFEDDDTNVGFEINGKEYDLMKKDINNPSKTAVEVAKENGNVFGIGFLDNTGKSEPLTAVPFTYDANGTIAKQEEDAIEFVMPECDNLYLKDLKINGTTITAFSPYKSYYYYETEDVSSITKEDITAEAEATYANVTVADAGNNNYVITTTAPDTEEAKTVEIRVREKGEPQNPEEQIASFKGSKIVRIKKDYSEEFLACTGSKSIYDFNENDLKADTLNNIASNSSNYSVALIQFDISKIENVNDRVLLNIPVHNSYLSTNPGRYAEIGFMAVDTELPINYHDSSIQNAYYNDGGNTSAGYQTAKYELPTASLSSTTSTNYTVEQINTEIKNAFAMVESKNFENDIADRVLLDNSVKETKTVDVTDYIKAKLENGDDTATFMVRAINNHDINESKEEVKIKPYTAEAELSFTKFKGEIAASDIKVNGTTLEDFNKDTLNYSVIVNKDADIPQVTATVADNENLTVKVTQATEVPGAATVKVTSYDGQSKTYTIKFDNPFEKGVFTFDLDASKRVDYNWGANYNKIANLIQLAKSNLCIRTYGNSSGYTVPKETLLFAFDTTAQGLNDDDRVFLNFYIKGYDPYATTPGGVPGGKAKVIYTQDSIEVDTVVDKTNYIVSSNYITSDITAFSIDVTDLVNTALQNTTAVDGKKSIQLLVDVDPADTLKDSSGNYIYSYGNINYKNMNLGGYIQLDNYSPTITYAE